MYHELRTVKPLWPAAGVFIPQGTVLRGFWHPVLSRKPDPSEPPYNLGPTCGYGVFYNGRYFVIGPNDCIHHNTLSSKE